MSKYRGGGRVLMFDLSFLFLCFLSSLFFSYFCYTRWVSWSREETLYCVKSTTSTTLISLCFILLINLCMDCVQFRSTIINNDRDRNDIYWNYNTYLLFRCCEGRVGTRSTREDTLNRSSDTEVPVKTRSEKKLSK